MKLSDYLEEYGYNDDVKESWSKNVALWRSWYQGKVKKFHNYTIYNGRNRVKMERASLQLAKLCCEDWADLLFNERCKISVDDETSNDELINILVDNDFWSLINGAIERSGSTGTGAIITSVKDIIYDEDAKTINVADSKVKLEYIDVEWIFPLSWEGKKIKECAFGARRSIKGKDYIYLSIHYLNNENNYIIKNVVFEDRKGNLVETQNDVSLDEFDTQSNIPWFSIFTPAGVNNIEPGSPWGIPYFANAIDEMKAADAAYDSLNNEISLGRKRIFVRQDLVTYDEKGEHLTFDDNDVAVYALPKDANVDDLIQAENSDLRVTQIKEAIETSLNMFSRLVGFGSDHYKFDAGSLQTATAVISQNSAMFRRKKKHEIPLESALYDVIISVSYAATKFAKYNINTNGLVITFDDSITEDTEARAARAMREVSNNTLSRVEYRQLIFGESEDAAKKAIAEIDEASLDVEKIINGVE